jgi:hypothetical protein
MARLTRIDRLRKIVAEGQYAKVEGSTVDLFSASAYVKVYDALSDANKAKLDALPLPAAIEFVFKLLNKVSQ